MPDTRKIEDLKGRRFGRLTVLDLAANSTTGLTRWRCLCDCGTETTSHAANLNRGTSRSCGCLQRDVTSARRLHGLADTPEHKAWRAMKTRCSNPKSTKFEYWGGRGIRVCDEWLHDFRTFLAYVGPRPSSNHSIDRINNDGNYEPGNVRWATRVEQNNNTRRSLKTREKTNAF